MPEEIELAEETEYVSIEIPVGLLNELVQNGVDNERTLPQTIRWALKQYMEWQHRAPRISYAGGIRYPGANVVYTKADADADDNKELT